MEHNDHYWDEVAQKTPVGQDYDELLANHYKQSHLRLFTKWIDFSQSHSLLKTDLFAEARCPSRSFSWDLMKLNGGLTGIDISGEICQEARNHALNYSKNPSHFITCDVRSIPFQDGSFDVIISDSTLDHYKNTKDIKVALKELSRTLKPGGTLCITLDNKTNFTEPLFRLWILLGFAPFYIGKTYSIKQLKRAIQETGLEITDCQGLIHNPRFFTKLMISILRRLFPKDCENWMNKSFNYFDSLESKKSRYLTAQFIAVRAVKPNYHV
jgi:ubiquinone/menaquinone biosynthesis C-methylase UbiE